MRPFAIVEGLLVASLAVALIAKPPTQQASASRIEHQPVVKTHIGEEVQVSCSGRMRAWVRTIDGRPTSMGITIPADAIPDAARLRLPSSVTVPPFSYLAIKGNAEGGEPHFDFSAGVATFNLSTPKPSAQTKPVSKPATYPPGYFPTSCSVTYDASSEEYTMSLDGLVAH